MKEGGLEDNKDIYISFLSIFVLFLVISSHRQYSNSVALKEYLEY
jgi:hypothetical protein